MGKLAITILVGVFCFITFSGNCLLGNPAQKPATSGGPAFRDEATALLFENLQAIGKSDCFLFGQANALTRSGLGKNATRPYEKPYSDIKDIVGSHPGFMETDFMWHSSKSGRKTDLEAMQEAYKLGMVTGYCWHMAGMHSPHFGLQKPKKNPDGTTPEGVPDPNLPLVKEILASKDRTQNKALDWFLSKYETDAIPVFRELGFPILFRPLHEMTGGWFWWGTAACTPEEYVELYRLVVTHLRSNKIRNLLYVWAPDKSSDLKYYPGDEYVDIIGYDGYDQGLSSYYSMEKHIARLKTLGEFAVSHGKVLGLTETGCGAYPEKNYDFWTKNVLAPLKNNGKKIIPVAYVMTWYNSPGKDGKAIVCLPYLGMESRTNGNKAIADFQAFCRDPSVLLADDAAALKLYSKPVKHPFYVKRLESRKDQ